MEIWSEEEIAEWLTRKLRSKKRHELLELISMFFSNEELIQMMVQSNPEFAHRIYDHYLEGVKRHEQLRNAYDDVLNLKRR